MINSVSLALLLIVFLLYFISAVFFWYINTSMIRLSKVIDLSIKSPRNRKSLEAHVTLLQKSKKNSLIWPVEVVLDAKDAIKKEK